MSRQDKILSTELKVNALRRVCSGLEQELAEIKNTASKPVPVNRNLKKTQRINSIAEFYLKRKIVNHV